jgi:putative component of membrane protein insertase Oxa1/YidC/SpoIIIJ protein YidD
MKDRSWLALWVTLAAQALVTFQLSIAPVIAPACSRRSPTCSRS